MNFETSLCKKVDLKVVGVLHFMGYLIESEITQSHKKVTLIFAGNRELKTKLKFVVNQIYGTSQKLRY